MNNRCSIMHKRMVIAINLLGVFGLSFILIGGYFFQFVEKEIPCPLCLLQRMAMIGVVFGLMLNLRYGCKPAHYSIAIISALLGAAISTRQILLHICTPGSGYGGSVFGLHLYTWAFIFFTVSLSIIALLLFYHQQFDFKEQSSIAADIPKPLQSLSKIAFWLIVLLSGANFFTTLFACGLGPCPDDPVSYQLLHGQWW